MKKAFLYVRVSTDEQADTGYSQRHQEETLKRFCALKDISVQEVFYEDHSAKSFQRPVWTKLLLLLKKHKALADVILFTKWDRFSRNAGDAYQMINTLNKLGVEPQAIEQPLDLSIPENKLMLAFYLAQPEVENDRRALNIIGGMRRARKEGRWMGKAPLGYINRNVDHQKSIVICERQGPIMKWVFEELAKGVHTVHSVLARAREKGLRMYKTKKHPFGQPVGSTPFWNALRNPVYIGQIAIAAYKGEEATWVRGKHPALISEATFYKVQDVLDGKRRKPYVTRKHPDRFPLRGFLVCPTCAKILTASSSKGRTQHYHYYHCTLGCTVRFTAASANDAFLSELRRWKPAPAVGALYKAMLQDMYREGDKVRIRELQRIKNDLALQEAQKVRLRKMRVADELDAEDYRLEKKECDETIIKLESELAAIADSVDISPQLEQAFSLLSNIDETYEKSDTEWKRDFLGSMFPEKLEFTGVGFRTARINEVAKLIFNLEASFSDRNELKKAAISPLVLVS